MLYPHNNAGLPTIVTVESNLNQKYGKFHPGRELTASVKLAMYPVSHGSAVACTARRRPNRRQSIHSAISHDLLERKGNLPRVVARTQTVCAHQACVRATRGEQEICVNVKLLTRENEGNCRTVIPPESAQMPIKSNCGEHKLQDNFFSEPRRVCRRNRRSGPRVSPTARRPGVRWECTVCTQSAPETSGQ